MAFTVERFTPRQAMVMYDGTNSADILNHDWFEGPYPVTLISEEDGVLVFNWGGMDFGVTSTLRIGDRLSIPPLGTAQYPGPVAPFETFDDLWVASPDPA